MCVSELYARSAVADNTTPHSNLISYSILGVVGEPLNKEAWLWYNNVVGGERCTVVDTYWQTGGWVPLSLQGEDAELQFYPST